MSVETARTQGASIESESYEAERPDAMSTTEPTVAPALAAAVHHCPVCGETGRETLYVARDRHYGIPGQWPVARCTGCGLVQLAPMLSNEELGKLYPTDYYAFQDIAAKRSTLLGKLKKIFFRSLEVEDPHFDKPGRVLDSGSGSGWALVPFKERGWECVGIDPSAAAVEFGRRQYGIDIDVGTVQTIHYPDNHFDYIRSNHSLEHDPDCADTLKEFRRIIKPDGKLLIGVPNIESAPARFYGEDWWYLCAPVHTYNYSRRHLTRLLESAGFEVERVRYCGDWGGVLGSMQIRLNKSDPALTADKGFLVNSTPMKVLGQGVSLILNLVGQGDCIEVTARPK